MKRGVLHSLLLALALVLLQACASDIPAAAPKSAAVEPKEPFFMQGFSRLGVCDQPEVGALAVEDGTIYGTGVLIDSTHVLTAGHCAETLKPYWFISGGEYLKIRTITVHPNYKIAGVLIADLAVLSLDTPCQTSPARMPQNGYEYARGDDLTVVGWGGGIHRRSNPGAFWYYGTLTEEPTFFKMLPYDATVWFGDSGGAVYDNNGVLVGIVSSLSISRGHLYENSVVRLDLFLNWIRLQEAIP